MGKGYQVVNVGHLLEIIGETETLKILEGFSCDTNADIDRFLKDKSIPFSKAGFAKTHLVMASYQGNWVIAGYFALSGSKSFVVNVKSRSISKTLRKRLAKFGTYNKDLNQYNIPAPLIGQLGKNSNYPCLIAGDELLDIACSMVKDYQASIGGRFVYLECEDIQCLRIFYERNGFVCFGVRELDSDEKDLKTTHLLQLLKYL